MVCAFLHTVLVVLGELEAIKFVQRYSIQISGHIILMLNFKQYGTEF